MRTERLSPNLTAIDFPAVQTEIASYLKQGTWSAGVKMGVIFEGGALRGVVSAGYGLAVSRYINAGSVFSLYGASSGGLNAIYYASDALEVALKIYEENATDPMCTNLWKFPNILNPDWLVDEWMFKNRRFDLDKINNRKPSVWLSLTDLDTGLPHYFNVKGSDPSLVRQAMKATAYAPLVSNGYQIIEGHRYGDGAISDAIPYEKARRDGCTHLICLLTRPPDYRKQHGFLSRGLETARLLHHTKSLREAWFARDVEYSQLLDRLYVSGDDTIPTLILHPAARTDVPGNLESRARVVAEMGGRAYKSALSALEDQFDLPSAKSRAET